MTFSDEIPIRKLENFAMRRFICVCVGLIAELHELGVPIPKLLTET